MGRIQPVGALRPRDAADDMLVRAISTSARYATATHLLRPARLRAQRRCRQWPWGTRRSQAGWKRGVRGLRKRAGARRASAMPRRREKGACEWLSASAAPDERRRPEAACAPCGGGLLGTPGISCRTGHHWAKPPQFLPCSVTRPPWAPAQPLLGTLPSSILPRSRPTPVGSWLRTRRLSPLNVQVVSPPFVNSLS